MSHLGKFKLDKTKKLGKKKSFFYQAEFNCMDNSCCFNLWEIQNERLSILALAFIQFVYYDIIEISFNNTLLPENQISIPLCDPIFDPHCVGSKTLTYHTISKDLNGQIKNQQSLFLDGIVFFLFFFDWKY